MSGVTGVTKLAGMSKEEGVGGGGEKEEVKGSLIMADGTTNGEQGKILLLSQMDAGRLR